MHQSGALFSHIYFFILLFFLNKGKDAHVFWGKELLLFYLGHKIVYYTYFQVCSIIGRWNYTTRETVDEL